MCENSLRDNLNIKTHTQERKFIIVMCVEGVLHKLCMKKSNTGKNQFRCQVCENSLRDNLYIITVTQKRNHIIVKCVESVSQTLLKKQTHERIHFDVKCVKKFKRQSLNQNTHTQKINHIIVKCVQSASQKVCMRYTKSCIIHSICESTSKLLLIEQAPISAQAPNSAQFAGNQIVHYWGRRL